MKRMIIVLAFMGSPVYSWGYSEELVVAVRDGALARITFHVTDSQGNSVSNAEAKIHFSLSNRQGLDVIGRTDTHGFFVAEGLCSGEIYYRFTKDDHFETRHKHILLSRNSDFVHIKEGRWQPWNPTIEVILKEVRNPVSLYVKSAEYKIPKGEIVGFDCSKGDLTAPHGQGIYSDFFILFSCSSSIHNNRCFTNSLLFSAGVNGGFIRLPKDGTSQFKSLYEAPEEGYQEKMVFSFKRGIEGAIEERLGAGGGAEDYLVFRSRVEKDETGKIVESRYGKIYAFRYGETEESRVGYLRLLYYFNPNNNDRNLEYDKAKGAFGESDSVR